MCIDKFGQNISRNSMYFPNIHTKCLLCKCLSNIIGPKNCIQLNCSYSECVHKYHFKGYYECCQKCTEKYEGIIIFNILVTQEKDNYFIVMIVFACLILIFCIIYTIFKVYKLKFHRQGK